METAIAEVRSVLHSIKREVIHEAAKSYPEVQRLMEQRVLSLMQQRGKSEKARVRVRRNSQLTLGSGADGEGSHPAVFDTLTIDVIESLFKISTKL